MTNAVGNIFGALSLFDDLEQYEKDTIFIFCSLFS